ncbi:MAG: restriction endonuclease subunit S [Lactobacillus paragasseri]|uniref:restriction endonuclease subunit S n=1 Tax=Lactobacillus paragasseri TaxID=2107999 RepID=UPI0018A06810|nr:restriction endonuclease subunit S [Lactobacillus paragasseri]MDU8979846.1 restriction endonuclease subunit S [Lactobacillus paragasseri]
MKYKLSDLAEVGSSKRIYAKEYQASGIPFYRGKEIIAKSEGRKVENSLFISEDRYNSLLKEYSVPKVNDILISAVGTIGKIYLVNKDDVPFYFKDGNLIRIYNYNSKLVDPYYMYYLLKSKCGQNAIKEIEIGSTQKAITIKEFSSIVFDIPSLKEQQGISYIFKCFDDQINSNSKINDNLVA